jgi:hypothetical protein
MDRIVFEASRFGLRFSESSLRLLDLLLELRLFGFNRPPRVYLPERYASSCSCVPRRARRSCFCLAMSRSLSDSEAEG